MSRAIVIAAMLLLIQVSSAQEPPPEAPAPETPPAAASENDEEARSPGPTTLEEAIQIAIRRFGGRAAGSETVVLESGRRVHEIRVYRDEGSVRTVRIDPETGAIL